MCKDFDAELMEMFREIYNFKENKRVSKTFPRELFSDILNSLSTLSELNHDDHIQCDVKLSYGLCKVEFSYHEKIPNEYGNYVEKIKEEYL